MSVSAFTINTRILRRDVAKTVLKVIHNDIKRELEMAPSWVSERVEDFVTKCDLLPFVKNKPKSKLVGGTGGSLNNSDSAPAQYSVTSVLTSQGDSADDGIEELSSKVQEFYLDLEEELGRRKWRFGKQVFEKGTHSNGSVSSGDEKEGEESDEKDQVEDEKEKRTREILENVERTLCSMFYDRYVGS